MTRLKLHYDGWLALPPAFRRALGLSTGAPLEAELIDGAIVLRPVAKTTPKAKAATAAGPEQARERGRGRGTNARHAAQARAATQGTRRRAARARLGA